MGWVIILASAAAALIALWKFGRLERQGLEVSAAAMLLALAGYAWWGSPSLKGAAAPPSTNTTDELTAQDAKLVPDGQFSAEGNAMMLSDAMMRAGKPRQAARILTDAIKAQPKSADLWVNLGNVLVIHGGGLMNPAAQVAFQRAADIDPTHPGPPFFTGLALAQSGKMDEAGEIWRTLLARAPKDAPWAADLKSRLEQMGALDTPKPQ